ncbi:MAG: hypothetical protein GY832_25550 [Chloroflexi bacterium]|nr:hypothetical protein [Chloroflexota bacterium]
MVPKSLRIWFVVHFIMDILFAVPLFVAPKFVLSLFGWTTIDPFATRLVAAALMGIGIESLLGRNADADTYRAMLNLKIIWAGAAILGMGITLVTGGPAMGWLALAIFGIFILVWIRYRLLLHQPENNR